MRTVTTENQRYLGEWLVRILNFPLPETTQCIGQLKDGNLVAVAGYTNFMPKACEIHIGSVGERSLSDRRVFTGSRSGGLLRSCRCLLRHNRMLHGH